MRTNTFTTRYFTESGTLMVIGDTFIVLVRVRDGLCKRFTYQQLGFHAVAAEIQANQQEHP